MLSKEQLEQIKKQLFEQIDKIFPPDKIELAKRQISAMDDKEFESFLIKNRLIKVEKSESNKDENQEKCIPCLIVQEKIPSFKIAEDKDSIAVLEINPLSKGHSLIIPKQHIKSLDQAPEQIWNLAKKVAKKIKSELKPKDIKIFSSEITSHFCINVVPIYDGEKEERTKATPEELKEMKKKLEIKEEKKKPKKKITEKNIWLPQRIP